MSTQTTKPVIHHIPVCPFSQRLEILLALKGLRDAVEFRVVDITRPRDPALLSKTRGTTALPVLELEDGHIIKESLVILRYIEDRYPVPPVMQADPYRRAVENMLIAMEGEFGNAGYRFVLNRDRDRREGLAAAMDAQYRKLEDFLLWQAPDRVFLDYYESYEIPAGLARVRRWRDACLAHPAAQQVSYEEIVKLYHDYALGRGNGALPEGRIRSSFVFDPHWRDRPWPPRDKWAAPVSDRELGLV